MSWGEQSSSRKAPRCGALMAQLEMGTGDRKIWMDPMGVGVGCSCDHPNSLC